MTGSSKPISILPLYATSAIRCCIFNITSMEIYRAQYERDLEKIIWEPKPHRCLEIWRYNVSYVSTRIFRMFPLSTWYFEEGIMLTLIHQSRSTHTRKEELIQDGKLDAWARREPKVHLSDKPLGGLRLILVTRCGHYLQTLPPSTRWAEPNSWPFTRKSLEAVVQHFQLPPMLVSPPSSGANHSTFGRSTRRIQYYVRTPLSHGQRFHCALSLDKTSMITSGIIVATQNDMLEYVLSRLEIGPPLESPVHILSAISEYLAEISITINDDANAWLCKLEYTSGEYCWDGLDEKPNRVPQEEYRGLTADLASVGTVVGAHERLSRYQESFNQFIIDGMDYGMCAISAGEDVRCHFVALREHITYLMITARFFVLACQSQQKKVQGLMSAVGPAL